MGKIVEESFKWILMLNVICPTFLLCALCYNILVCLVTGDKTMLISFFVYIFLVLLILYTLCSAGESLVIESNRVCKAYYSCKWYQMSKKDAKIILICIHRSQQPLRLRAGKFSTFCLTTFTDTLKTAMGYLSVLRKVM